MSVLDLLNVLTTTRGFFLLCLAVRFCFVMQRYFTISQQCPILNSRTRKPISVCKKFILSLGFPRLASLLPSMVCRCEQKFNFLGEKIDTYELEQVVCSRPVLGWALGETNVQVIRKHSEWIVGRKIEFCVLIYSSIDACSDAGPCRNWANKVFVRLM